MDTPGGFSKEWVAGERVEKYAIFQISRAEPFVSDSWPARWGGNRPEFDRPHPPLSEFEITVQHSLRGTDLVRVNVKGDSEPEVDAFMQSLKAEFERTYTGADPKLPNLPTKRGFLHEIQDPLTSPFYWRQRYFWLVVTNLVVLVFLWFVVKRGKSTKTS